ncbi:MAG: HEPN domain-containing protein [Planctomycetes bacterium]|nr:HEPN domain-containing protein [Planctomycetota bacterium]
MKPSSREWVDKAEEDYRLMDAAGGLDPPAYDGLCFHAQQAAEKYLKAVLAERVTRFPKVHDLTRLLDLIDPAINELTVMRADLDALSRLSVQVRYPGFSADSAKAEEAGRIAATVRRICRRELGLEEG